MIWAALLAAGVGAGVWVCARALWPEPRPLRVAAAEVRMPRAARDPTSAGELATWIRRVAWRLAGGTSPRMAADLAVTGRSAVRHTLDKLGYLVAGVLIGGLASAVLPLVGGGASWYPLAATVALAAVGFVAPDLALRSQAQGARRRWSHALTVYVDIVAISLAGGAGVDDALYGAASAGQGPEFDALGAALLAARTRRRTLWNALDELGRQLDVTALRELAASIDLAGETGSRIRETLLAKAKAMRNRQLADAETDAQRATETMGVAPALMAVAAVVLIGYPAVARFVGS